MTEGTRARSPLAEPAGHHIGHDRADILLLCRVVAWASVVARRRQSPASLFDAQVFQKLRGIINVLAWIEHVDDRVEVTAVEVVVDLHAADIDQLSAGLPRLFEFRQRLRQSLREVGWAFDIQRIGMQRAAPAGFGERDSIENTQRHAVLRSCACHLALANKRIIGLIGRVRGSASSRSRRRSGGADCQTKCKDRREQDSERPKTTHNLPLFVAALAERPRVRRFGCCHFHSTIRRST